MSELLRLANEQPISNEAVDSAHGIQLPRADWTDDRAFRQSINEIARLRHDQVRLQKLGLVHGEVHERQRTVSQWDGVPCLVMPNLEVHDFGSADTDRDS